MITISRKQYMEGISLSNIIDPQIQTKKILLRGYRPVPDSTFERYEAVDPVTLDIQIFMRVPCIRIEKPVVPPMEPGGSVH